MENNQDLEQKKDQTERLHALLLSKIDARDQQLSEIHKHPFRFVARLLYHRYIKKDIDLR